MKFGYSFSLFCLSGLCRLQLAETHAVWARTTLSVFGGVSLVFGVLLFVDVLQTALSRYVKKGA